ncbi:MAG: O-antigen ligase family protein [Burkholderiaceae bacterium]
MSEMPARLVPPPRIGRLDAALVAAWLAAALPGLVLVKQQFTGYVGLVWLGFCIWHWRSLRGHPEGRRMLRSPFAMGFIGSVLLLALLLLIHRSDDWGQLHNPSRFVLVLPMAVAVAVLRPSCRPYFGIAACAGLLGAAVAVWQVLITAQVGPLDAHLGFTNRNKFAYVVGTLLLVTLAGLRLPPGERPPRALLLAGALGALVALVLANTRGAWLAVLVPLGVWLLASRALPVRGRVLAATASVLLVAGLVATPGSPVRDRIELGLQQYEAYTPGHVIAGDSVAERLEMWRASLVMADAHPWIGIGPGRFNEGLGEMIAAGEAPASLSTQGHPHSEYLEALATGGVVGLIALLAALLGPLVHFIMVLRRGEPGRSASRACALAGALVVGATIIFCATDPFFYIHFSTLYYALSVALLAGFADAAARNGG